MSFTQSCFIRKNTPELIEKLRDLGLNFYAVTNGYYLLVQHGEVVGLLPETTLEYLKNRGVIDCEENEDLFLALAALRDDTDFLQWFVWDKTILTNKKGKWMLSYVGNMRKDMIEQGIYHKATPEELIEHFKDK